MKKTVEFYRKNYKKLILVQIILCIFAVIAVGFLSGDKREIGFDENNISAGIISEDKSFYIDENDGSYGYVLDIATDKIKKGWYKVRVEYDTGYDDNGFIVQALRPGNVLNEDIGNEERAVSLKGYHNSQEVHAWLKKDSDLRIAVHFCGGGYLQIKRIMLQQIPNYTPIFLIIFCLLFVNIELCEAGRFSEKEIKRRRYIRGGIACIVLLGSIPLMNDFNIHGHDYKYHLYCMEGVVQGLLSGQFPVRVMPNWWNEFGDGAPMFYGDIMLYFPAAVSLLGYSLQTAYKCYIVFINLLTAGIAYKCFYKISKDDKAALLGAFLYSLNLYRLIDIYVRCAVGEYTALTFLPLILLGIYLMEEDGWKYMAIGLTGCIQTHILVCVMTAFFFLVFGIIKIKWVLKKQVFLNFCKTGVITLLWNAWFIIPFLNVYLSKGYKIHFYETKWKLEEKGIPFFEIFKLYFNGMSERYFVIGLPLITGLVAAIIIYVVYRKRAPENEKERKLRILLKYSGFMATLALILSMDFIPYSKVGSVHEIINRLINVFEFPFRFMSMAALLAVAAIVSAFAIRKNDMRENKKRKRAKTERYVVAGCLVVLATAGVLTSYWKLLTGDFPYVKNYEYYAIGYIMDMDKWLPAEADQGEVDHGLIKSAEDIQVSDYKKEYTNIDMTCINGGEEGYVDVPLFYYPCYRAKDRESGQMLPLTYGENARIRIILPAGYQGTIELKVSERKLWRAAELISIFSVLLTWYVVMKNLTVEDIMVKIGKGKHKS